MHFDEAIGRATRRKRKPHVLLGNGFSIGAHPKFEYGSLYEQAREAHLPGRVDELFEEYGTTNFEAVLQRLDIGLWLARHYGMDGLDEYAEMQNDYEETKQALVDSIASIHPAAATEFSDAKLQSARLFLDNFQTIFTTNYDLLLYWSLMSGEDSWAFEDGFGRQVSHGESFLAFHGEKVDESRGSMYYLHGALHLATVGGEVRKLAWSGSHVRIIDQVQIGLDAKQYPLVVSEGSADHKAERIQGSGYLYRAFLELQRVNGALFVYGHSLGEEDEHIRKAIVENTDLKVIYVGIFGNQSTYSNRKLKERAIDLILERDRVLNSRNVNQRPLRVRFFDSGSAHVWDAS
ncbi:MAG: DUF4917 family protein [Chloroflexota bacterium]|nr:DUF4917 family protein [Chloroflexota bacterium]